MTERHFSITTPYATSNQTAFTTPILPFSPNDAPSGLKSTVEEDGKIECICGYPDDDGNTILCEKCDTWQHIECYYPGRIDDASRDDFDHTCAGCHPRPLDSRAAKERQDVQRESKAASQGIDKKTKRLPSKSHKKKPKPTDVLVNGHRDDGHRNGSPQDHPPPAKKNKGHRSQASVSSHQKRSPPITTHNHGHPPSPAHTPPDLPNSIQKYSECFLSLYNNDPDTFSKANNFSTVEVCQFMSSWLHDPKRLKEDTNVENKDDIFQYLTVDVNELNWVPLRVKEKEAIIDDVLVRWKYLVTPSPILMATNRMGERIGQRIGELKGVVGFQKDYCENPDNRWVECAHPRPFVFFLPSLPLFIDTREEGSILRYARRSCHPNASLEIFIANGTMYHFWFVTERDLAANEQITIPWDFGFPSEVKARYMNALKMGSDDGSTSNGPDITEQEYQSLSDNLLLVLADHGGCACDLGPDCSFARFHAKYSGRPQPQPQPNGTKGKKGRKVKQSHVSPTSTGHATNSRAASEGQDQHDEDDNHSVSGSVRSKPRSRDLTPAHGIGEVNGIPLEQSDREKRKLAMVEDTFKKMEKMEQHPQQPRKKKRPSDGSTTNITLQTATAPTMSKPRQRSVAPRPSVSHPSLSNGSRARQQIDGGKPRRQSGSPYSGISPTGAEPSPKPDSPPPSAPSLSRHTSVVPKPTYTSSSTQTDDEKNAWYKEPIPRTQRKIIPLATRLLRQRKAWHENQLQQRSAEAAATTAARIIEDAVVAQASPTTSMDLDIPAQHDVEQLESPKGFRDRHPSISSSQSADTSIDTAMVDAPSIIASTPIKPPPPRSIQTVPGPLATIPRSQDLRVQLPPAPTFSPPTLTNNVSGSGTPSSTTGSVAQSPIGNAHLTGNFPALAIGTGNPSPAKATKKLSLSDYNKMKKSNSSTVNKQVSPVSMKPTLSMIEEMKTSVVLDGSAVVDSPMPDITSLDQPASVPSPSDSSLKNNIPLMAKPNGSL